MPMYRTVSNRTSHYPANGIINVGGYRWHAHNEETVDGIKCKECTEYNYWTGRLISVLFGYKYNIKKRAFQIGSRSSEPVMNRWKAGGYQSSWKRMTTSVWK